MTAPADPELRLAAACCRWPPSPARNAAVQAATAGVDWYRFGRVVQRQRCAGLVEPALRAAGVTVPERIAASLARHAKQIVHSNLVAASDTARLTTRIADAGYPVVAIKGVVLGALAYDSIGVKHSKDIDLMILPEHLAPVLALLEADGYRITQPASDLTAEQRAILPHYGKDVALMRPAHVQVELHWRLFTNPELLPMLGADGPIQQVKLATNLSAPTLAPADLYAYLVLHGSIDGWSRMKSLADLNALVAQSDHDTVIAWHDRAVALGAGPASEQALVMMHDLFALSVPPRLAETIGQSRRVRLLIAGAYRLMAVQDGATEIDGWAFGRMLSLAMQPLIGRGLRYQWHIVRSVLYMQSDMYSSKLPPSLYPLYPLVRIPAWLGSRIARGVRHLLSGDKPVPAEEKMQ